MNPKDMTDKHLIDSVCEAISLCDLDAANKFQQELLRRLDEADALRKENEELRNLFGECPKRNNRLGTYSDAKPVQIDVCKLICMTKESEASHE